MSVAGYQSCRVEVEGSGVTRHTDKAARPPLFSGQGSVTEHASSYCQKRQVSLSFEEALAKTRDALSAEGFGILSEIDVRATLQKKLQVDFPPYTILGACNPPLAHKALAAERDIGVLLPCNVVVYEGAVPGESVVAAVDPEVSLGGVGNPALAPLAREVKERLGRVLAAIAGDTPANAVL